MKGDWVMVLYSPVCSFADVLEAGSAAGRWGPHETVALEANCVPHPPAPLFSLCSLSAMR